MTFGTGHVPVGTGHQHPYGYQLPVMGYQYTPPPQIATPTVVVLYPPPEPEPVVLFLTTPHPTLNAVTVFRDGGEPARYIPPSARAAMRQRTHYASPHTPVVVHAQHAADSRQVPGHGHIPHAPFGAHAQNPRQVPGQGHGHPAQNYNRH